MKKKVILITSISLLIFIISVVTSSILGYKTGYSDGYDEAAKKGYGYLYCVEYGNGFVMSSSPPQCVDKEGTKYPGP